MRMGKYTGPTAVLFRVDRRKDADPAVVAVFPEEPACTNNYDMVCYERVGQHSSCSHTWYHTTSAARPEEYADLKQELESIGYKLKVYKRMQPKHREAFMLAIRRKM